MRRLLATAAVAALLAGCHSSGIAFNPPGGSGGNIVTLVIASYDVGTSLGAIAYETGPHGTWKLLPSGQTTFTVPNGTQSYGVAYVCANEDVTGSIGRTRPQAEEGLGETEYAVQATLSDYHTVAVTCFDGPTTGVSGSYDVTAVEGSQINAAGDFEEGPTGTYSGSVPSNTADILAAAYTDEGGVVGVKTYPNTTVGTSPVTQNVTFSASDHVGSTSTLTSTAAPGGFEQLTTAQYYTADLGVYLNLAENEGTTVTFPAVASADATGLYGLSSAAESEEGEQVLIAFDGTPTAANTNLTLPAPWTPSSPTSVADPTFTLNYTGFPSPPAGSIFSYAAYFDEECTSDCEAFVNVTNKFLQSTGGSTYQVPQIPLTGFPVFNGTGDVEWFLLAELNSGIAVDFASPPIFEQVLPIAEQRGQTPQSAQHWLPQSRSAAGSTSQPGHLVPLSNAITNITAQISGYQNCYAVGGSGCT